MKFTDNIFDNLWIKKYAPKNINEMVLSEDVRERVKTFIEEGNIPSLLFCGKPGQGKTTLATLLCEEMGATTLMINASFDNGIDVIRGKVNNFVQLMSIDGSIKVVILDEADRLSAQSQDALRGMIEENAAHTRFILTANERSRITDALQSRCIAINITPPKNEFKSYIINILKQEQIGVKANNKDDVTNMLLKFYPDLRRSIGFIQNKISNNILVVDNSELRSSLIDEIMIDLFSRSSNEIDIRTLWLTRENEFQGDYQWLLKQLHAQVYAKNDLNPQLRAQIILNIYDGLTNSINTLDQEINFYATILYIMQSLR